MKDNRRSPRYKVHKMVRLDFGHEGLVPAETLNFSAQGLLCKMTESLPDGTRLAVLLEMEDEGTPFTIQLEARVVRQTAKDQVALELLEPTAEGSAKFLEFFQESGE